MCALSSSRSDPREEERGEEVVTRKHSITDAKDLVRLLEDARVVSDASVQARDEAIAASVRACRLLEERLKQALGGGPLRGLPNLGSGNHPQHLIRVRTRATHAMPLSEREVLCLSRTGDLVIAKLGMERRISDKEIMASDAQDFAYALTYALERHIDASTRTESRSDALVELSQRIEKVLKGE